MYGYLILSIGLTFSLVINSPAIANQPTTLTRNRSLNQESPVTRINEVNSSKSMPRIRLNSNSEQYTNIYEKIAQTLLTKRAEDASAFHASLRHVFGPSYNYRAGEHVRNLFVQGDFSWMPEVQVVPQSVMTNAGAAYSARYKQIYLSAEATDSPLRILLYLEESGHYLDTILSDIDSLGDEGEEFMRRMVGVSSANRPNSDHGVIALNGHIIAVEFGFWSDIKDVAGKVVDVGKGAGGWLYDRGEDAGGWIKKGGKWVYEKGKSGSKYAWKGAKWTVEQIQDGLQAAGSGLSSAWNWVTDDITWKCAVNTLAAGGACSACGVALLGEVPSGGTSTIVAVPACSGCVPAFVFALEECFKGGATTENSGIPDTAQCTNFVERDCVGSTVAQLSNVTINDSNVHQNYKLKLYDGTNFKGNWQAVGFGDWFARHIQLVGNDHVSSLSVPPGMHVTAFQHHRGVGVSHEFFYGKNESAQLNHNATNLNNRISSVEVRPAVTVFEGRDFDGRRWSLKEGYHYSSQWGHSGIQIRNDTISSYIVGAGVMAKFCSDLPDIGICITVQGDTRGILPSNINDRTSYIEVTDGVTLYDKAWYKGEKSTLKPGIYKSNQLGIGNDKLSSLIAAPGIKVAVCSDRPGIGICREYRGAVWFLNMDLNNRASTVIVEREVGVKLYEAKGFGGFPSILTAGTYKADQLGIANDTLSSLISAPGIATTVYSDRPGIGIKKTFQGYVGDIGSALENTASTLFVEEEYHATIYDGINYAGAKKHLKVGTYKANQLGIGNDKLSSLTASPGIVVTVCSDRPGIGVCKEFKGSVAYIGEDLGNRASTIIVKKEQ